MQDYIIQEDKDVAPKEFLDIAKSVGWVKNNAPSIDLVEKALKNTFWIIHIRDKNNKLVACARVLSDDLFFSTIPDIFVRPEYQHKGLGKYMMDRIQKRFGHTKIFFGARPGQEKFYETLGFEKSYQSFQNTPK